MPASIPHTSGAGPRRRRLAAHFGA